MVLIYSKSAYKFNVQNRFLVIHECNEKTPPATIYIARDTVPTQWTAAPRYANNMSKSLPNALNCVNRERGFYVHVKTILTSFPNTTTVDIDINVANESETFFCDDCPESGTSLERPATNYIDWESISHK